MRRRSWLLLGLLGAIVLLAGPARGRPGLETLLGALVLAALVVAVSHVRWRPRGWQRMPELFVRPGPGRSWCAGCGAPRTLPCPECGPREDKGRTPNRPKTLRKRA